ncbi:hypothetical protein [Cryobacterium aureum]|uniref:hypothetical protein n=1 Tax=Cryobacterium aureum TaxID=995037 RepID=UPI00101AEB98|nr:hypothetical protein [Cryobacterium aureum]
MLTTVALFLAAGTLSGCAATQAPAPIESTAPTAEATTAPTETPPVFASNDEALAAAEAAYSNYLAAGDAAGAIDSDSWKEFLALSTGPEHDATVQSRELMQQKGWSFAGRTQFDSMVVQSSKPLPNSTWEIRTYLCLDLSATDTVNETGDSVVSHDGTQRSPMLVVFVTPNENSHQLLISESPLWSGSDFCS